MLAIGDEQRLLREGHLVEEILPLRVIVSDGFFLGGAEGDQGKTMVPAIGWHDRAIVFRQRLIAEDILFHHRGDGEDLRGFREGSLPIVTARISHGIASTPLVFVDIREVETVGDCLILIHGRMAIGLLVEGRLVVGRHKGRIDVEVAGDDALRIQDVVEGVMSVGAQSEVIVPFIDDVGLRVVRVVGP